ncbi:CAP domain-containing protein [Proteinivorax hydrogeniformans]|uniref:CAP domain-containing protein n=1 Tax=Proteinivorax hydrogeniformans TaxID=1826727 RepID=A0AAU8HV28_9FIRM
MKKITTYLTLGVISTSVLMLSAQPAEAFSYRSFLQQFGNSSGLQNEQTTEHNPHDNQESILSNFWTSRRQQNQPQTDTEDLDNKPSKESDEGKLEEGSKETAEDDNQVKENKNEEKNSNLLDNFWARRGTRTQPSTPQEQKQEQPTEQQPIKEETQPTSTHQVSQRELSMLELINEERKAAGVAPLKIDEEVSKWARVKSQDFINSSYFAHESPVYGRAGQMLREGGVSFTRVGENIASSQSYVVSHHRLMASDGHRRNILNPNFTHVGIGIVDQNPSGVYVTQIFTAK